MNRNIYFLFFTFVFANHIFAQEPSDALRSAWNVQSGTARIQAIGGAMGSLGGDITATFVNPAGLGFYRTGDLVFTPMYSFGKTNSTYLGLQNNTTTNKFAIGTSGVVFSSSDSKTKTSAFSLAINQVADFKTDILYRGQNNVSSYSQKFLDEINNANIKDGNRVDQEFEFGTSLAFRTYWIDTVGGGTNGSFRFQTRAPITTGLLQQNKITTSGGITEFAIGFGTSINEKVLIGGTLGIPIMRYERASEFVEADATNDATNKFDYALYKQGLTTTGAGLNLKAGIIYKPDQSLRLGFAFHTPTIFSLTDKNSASITTNTESYKGSLNSTNLDINNASSLFKYVQVTPIKLMGSISYLFHGIEDVSKQKGFLTADVEWVDYPMLSYGAEDKINTDQQSLDYIKSLNQAIGNAYKSAFNFRAGGELKFTTLMVRAGVAYYGNPYNNIHNEDGSRLNISGGLGYRNRGFFIDATYVHAVTKDVDVAYRLNDPAKYFNADIKNTTGKILITFGFKI